MQMVKELRIAHLIYKASKLFNPFNLSNELSNKC